MSILTRASWLALPAAAAVAFTMAGTGVAAASDDTVALTEDDTTVVTVPTQPSSDFTLQPFTYLKPGNGFTGAVPDSEGVLQPAMSYVLDANGAEVYAFCVDFTTDIDEKAQFTPASWDSSNVTNMAKAADIAARHLEIGTPLEDPRREDLATQVAIWKLTNNVRTDSTGQEDVTKRARELYSNAVEATEVSWNLNVEPTVTVEGTGDDAVYTVAARVTADGEPVPASSVEFSVGERNLVEVSDSDGVASVQLPARYAGENVELTASTIVPAGVFLQASTGQNLVTANSTPVTVNGFATLTPAAEPEPAPEPAPQPEPEATVVPEPEPEPTVAPSPDTNSESKPTALPTTGADTNPLPVFLLMGVAAAGVAGFVYSRRR